MSFSDDVQSWANKALQQVSDKNNQIVQDAFSQMVFRSPSPVNPGPYAKGLLVNQYYTMVGPGYSTAVSSSKNPSGADSLSRIASTISSNPFLGKDNSVSLSNNTWESYHADVIGWRAGAGSKGLVRLGAAPYMMTSGTLNYIQNKYQ